MGKASVASPKDPLDNDDSIALTLRTKAAEVRNAMARVPGIVDLVVEPQVGVPQVQIVLDRRAAALRVSAHRGHVDRSIVGTR